MGRVLVFLIIVGISVSCSNDSLSEDDLFYVGPASSPPKPLVTQEDLKCAELGDNKEFVTKSVFEAVLIKEEATEFARLLQEFENLNPSLKLKDRYPYHTNLSLIVPTDKAFEIFYKENPNIKLEGDTLEMLVKHHVLVEFLSISHPLSGGSRSTTLNYQPMPMSVDEFTCIYFGKERALVTLAEEKCSNGFIHTIDRVLVPW